MIRVKYHSHDYSETLFNREYDDIEEAENAIADLYKLGVYRKSSGHVRVFVNDVRKQIEVFAKIIQ